MELYTDDTLLMVPKSVDGSLTGPAIAQRLRQNLMIYLGSMETIESPSFERRPVDGIHRSVHQISFCKILVFVPT